MYLSVIYSVSEDLSGSSRYNSLLGFPKITSSLRSKYPSFRFICRKYLRGSRANRCRSLRSVDAYIALLDSLKVLLAVEAERGELHTSIRGYLRKAYYPAIYRLNLYLTMLRAFNLAHAIFSYYNITY